MAMGDHFRRLHHVGHAIRISLLLPLIDAGVCSYRNRTYELNKADPTN